MRDPSTESRGRSIAVVEMNRVVIAGKVGEGADVRVVIFLDSEAASPTFRFIVSTSPWITPKRGSSPRVSKGRRA